MTQHQLSNHVATWGCYWSLKHDNKLLGLFRTECKDNWLLKCLVCWIFDRPTLELCLRIFSKFEIIWRWLERQIFLIKGGQKLLGSLRKRIRRSVNFKRECLQIESLVWNNQTISQVLSREKLSERNDFLIDSSDLSNVQLSPLTSFSRFEQIGGTQMIKLAKNCSWLLEAAQHFGCNKLSEISDIFAWASVSLKHPYLLLFLRTGLLRAGKGGDNVLIWSKFMQHLDISSLLGTRPLTEGFKGWLGVLQFSLAALLL